MDTSKISPPPFKVESIPARRTLAGPFTYYTVRDRRNVCVAVVGQVDAVTDDGEGLANARLFAAAPALLDALRGIEQIAQADWPPSERFAAILSDARAALAQVAPNS